ncbi:MAG: SRPBCC domain-containing protein [Pirellula sp.]
MNQPQPPANSRATTVKRLFSRQTSVAIDIAAPATTLWALLTDAGQFAAWNSTILELTGTIATGGRIALRSKLAPDRTFKLRVKTFDPPNRLSWGDAMGTRTYMLTPMADGRTRFSMTEIIGGPIFPLFARIIPSFDDSFNQIAADLKNAAEAAA